MRSMFTRHILLLLVAFYIKHSHQVAYTCNSTAACGCSTSTASVTRIVGGEVAGSNTWGWAVSIQLGSGGLCGGAIIASQWILTAAHCLTSVTASQVTVYAGSNTKWSGQIRTVSAIYIHSSYNSGTKRNDIALLRLSSALNMSDPNVKIACIPSVSSSVLSAGEWPPANVDVSIRQSLASELLLFSLYRSWPLVGAQRRRVDPSLTLFNKWRWARSLPLHRCAAQSYTIRCFSSVLVSHVVDEVSLSQYKFTLLEVYRCSFLDTCQGDSGGPIMMYTTSRQWVVIGVTSYGIGCALASYAGVYTRIAYYQSWINSTMSGSAPINPASSSYTVSTLISGCTTQGTSGLGNTTSTSTISTLTTARTTQKGSGWPNSASRYMTETVLVCILMTLSIFYRAWSFFVCSLQ